MRNYRKYVNLCVFLLIVAASIPIQYNPFSVNVSTIELEPVIKNETLYNEIEKKSEALYVEPQDAYIDRVWKKTPGRNGLKVNVEKSYEKMLEKGKYDEKQIVYEQIPPAVKIEDLPAAPIYRGHPEKEMVAFLINVSWGEEYIPEILNTLKENKVKATFFIEGKWAKANSELVKMIDEQGHLIGNHAYNHPDMARLSTEDNVNQINQTNQILTAIIDKKPRWFAPPSGSFDDQVIHSAYELNMETILWTVDTIDWKNPSVSVMINRVNEKIHPGATVLMHPTEATESGLDELINVIKDSGYELGTIEMLLNEER